MKRCTAPGQPKPGSAATPRAGSAELPVTNSSNTQRSRWDMAETTAQKQSPAARRGQEAEDLLQHIPVVCVPKPERPKGATQTHTAYIYIN